MKLDLSLEKIPFKLMGKSKVLEKSKDRVIAGYANVAVVDSEDQFIPLETLQQGINTLLKNPAFANLMLTHQNIQIGQILSEYGKFRTAVDDKGLFIICKIRDDLEIANQLWEAMLENQFRGFSIGCEVINDHLECDETKCITVLDKINIFEVSVCNHPVNNTSGFVVISKSMLKDEDMCINKDAIDMAKKTKAESKDEKIEVKEEQEAPEVETKVEVKDEEKEEPKEEPKEEEEPKENSEEQSEEQTDLEGEKPEIDLKDKFASLEAKINALESLIQQTLETLSGPDDDDDDDDEPPCVECGEEKPEEVKENKEKKEDDEEEEEEEEEMKQESEPVEDPNSKVLEQILELLQSIKSERDFDAELKARDDALNALDQKVKTLVKSKDEVKTEKKADVKPQTLPSDEPEYVIKRSSTVRVDRGTVYFDD